MQQVDDFVAESEALHDVLAPLPERMLGIPTQFKGWTIDQVIQHLHFFNVMVDLALTDPDRFRDDYAHFDRARADGSMTGATDKMLEGLAGQALQSAWRSRYLDMAQRWRAADPKARVPWVGPSMGVRSAITARQMETWAHGQEVFDVLGLDRGEHDRIRNIAHLGVRTYGWTFANRGETPPEPVPFVRLRAPSGAIWEWGEPSETERIEGSATDFCQVVTQTRSIADVQLSVSGENAARWMSLAQCFAGPPETPPPPGTRSRAPRPTAL